MAPEISSATARISFTLFPKLPTEVRLMIWKMTLPGPRAFELRSNYYFDMRAGDGYATSTDPQPVNLMVCRESRNEALKIYTVIFPAAIATAKCYFDPALDILFLSCGPCYSYSWLLATLTAEALGSIENVCMPYYPYFWTWGLLEILTGIKTLACPNNDDRGIGRLMITPPRPFDYFLATIEAKIDETRKTYEEIFRDLIFPALTMMMRGS